MTNALDGVVGFQEANLQVGYVEHEVDVVSKGVQLFGGLALGGEETVDLVVDEVGTGCTRRG